MAPLQFSLQLAQKNYYPRLIHVGTQTKKLRSFSMS